MNDEYPEVRAALDAVLTPVPAPVDLSGVYRAAHELQVRSARRWKRAAGALAALAAGVIVVALIPKLDVRLTGYEFAIRWGQPPVVVVEEPAVPTSDARISTLIDDQQKQIAAMRAINSKSAEMQELMLALTIDVAERDIAQLERIAALTRELRAFQLATARQFDQTEKTSTTLYNAMFTNKPKTGD